METRSFTDIAAYMCTLHEMKNSDYGNAFAVSFLQYEGLKDGAGLQYAVGRMGDKMQRITNLAFKGNQKVKGESIKDTLIDMAAYCIMTVQAIEAAEAVEEYSEQQREGTGNLCKKID